MRTVWVVALAVALVACKSSRATERADAAARTAVAAPPASWWTATPIAGNDTRTGAMRFSANELVFAPQESKPKLMAATLESGDGKRWQWSSSEGDQPMRCTLDESSASHATFECTSGSKRQAFKLEPMTDEKRAAELDALVERSRPPTDACARAEACGPKVFTLLDSGTFHADVELGAPRSPQKCAKALRGLRMIVEATGREMPPECSSGRSSL